MNDSHLTVCQACRYAVTEMPSACTSRSVLVKSTLKRFYGMLHRHATALRDVIAVQLAHRRVRHKARLTMVHRVCC